MGMFNDLLSMIFGHASAAPGIQNAIPSTPVNEPAAAANPATSGASSPLAASLPETVDVTATLDSLAVRNSEKLDWRSSIVDLLKLVGMESSLSARKQLATEMRYPGDQSDSATMNLWLHKQVLRQLSLNGGKVPRELL